MYLLLFLFLLLLSCSENLYYNEATPRMTIEVLNKSDTIAVGDSVYFQARIVPSHAPVKKFYWLIGSREFLQLNFGSRSLFNESGILNVSFNAIDPLGDTSSTSFTISVANKPVCKKLELEHIHGSPVFKWECYDVDDDKLTYNFLLKNKNATILNTTVLEDSLQLGYALPSDYWEVYITATNSHGFKAGLDSIWSKDEE
ncbi:MAG: hypothetical protein LBU89_04910 [Fibromonadaceae bacterium]|jgi:hypothetical protein|nr:hypothetical protein [Fibromonadaceae bacterium]